MATPDYGKYGLSPIADYQNYGLTPVQDQSASAAPMEQQQAPMSLLGRVGRDIGAGLTRGAAGLAQTGQDIGRAGVQPLVNALQPTAQRLLGRPLQMPAYQDYTKQVPNFGITQPTLLDKAIQGAAQIGPYAFGGEAGIPSLLAREGLRGVISGATQEPNHLQGGIAGGIGGIAAGVGGKLLGGISGIPGVVKDYLSKSKAVQDAPGMVEDLYKGAMDVSNPNASLKQELNELGARTKAETNRLAKPLNETNVRLDIPNAQESFPKYLESSKELLDQRDHLKNLFGTTSDMGSKLNKELDIADNMLNNKKVSPILDQSGMPILTKGNEPVGFQDVWQRIKTLGDLTAKAKRSGFNNEARMLGDLRGGLVDDFHNLLNNTGNKDLSDSLNTFNNHFKYNELPLRSDKTIRKTILDKAYIPSKDSLAQAIYKPSLDNVSVADRLSPNGQNIALGQILSKGQMSPTGKAPPGFVADDIAKNWSSLDTATKSKLASHMPDKVSSLENLASIFGKSSSFGIPGMASKAAGYVPMIGKQLQTTMPMFMQGNKSAASPILAQMLSGVTIPGAANTFGGGSQ